MNPIERTLKGIRHLPVIAGWTQLWDLVRPLYMAGLRLFAGSRGLERVINGTDAIRVPPDLQGVPEVYEPKLWAYLMGNLAKGDNVVEVGAYIGLFSVAMARHVGETGKILAFEPDPGNFGSLRKMIAVNGISSRVIASPLAMGNASGTVWFEPRESQSHISDIRSATAVAVAVSTLDEFLAGTRVDVLKIDVEGHELEVLRGASKLLADRALGPRVICIEVHPYAWPPGDSTSRAMLELLRGCGYRASGLDGPLTEPVAVYGHLVACRQRSR